MRVLVVGGSTAEKNLLGRLFSQRNAEQEQSASCNQALQQALAIRPHLILCGDSAAWGEGHRLLHQVRNAPTLRSTPFVLFTDSEPDPETRELLLAHGATAVLTLDADGAHFWQGIDAALEQVRVEKARRREQALADEADFLRDARMLLGDRCGPEWTDLVSEGERFRTMVESSLDWFWAFDQNANFTYVSPRIRDLLGYEPEEVLGQNAFDLMDPAEAERVHQHFDPIAQKYLPFSGLINVNRHKDGHEVVIESSGTPIFAGDGRFLGYRGIDRDITERQRADRVLRESEERLREAQEVARLGHYSYDVASGTWTSSAVLDTIFGIPEGYPKTVETWLDLIHPDHRSGTQAYLQQTVLQGGQPFNRSYKIVRPSDGKIRWVHGLGRLECDADGNLVRMLGTIQDITPQKLIEEQLVEALRESHAARKQLDTLFTSVADALVVTDPYQRVTLLNQAAEHLFNKSLAEVRHQPVNTLIREPAFVDHLQALLTGEEAGPIFEFSLAMGADSPARHIQARIALVRDAQDRVTRSIAILRDITREREVDRMKSEFISIAAHELRTPLTAVTGYAELLEQEQAFGRFSDSQRREFLETILQKCEQLRIIVDDLLSLSRIESGRPISLDRKSCRIIPELKRMITSHGLEAAGHAYSMDFSDEEVWLSCDCNKIEQVLDNLLSNAAKYSPGEATIRIRGELLEEVFLVEVADRGIGMSPGQLERMFDKFYRADMTETSVGGLGLGMSISKSIIEAHGGTIWAESVPGEGTTVRFTLPLAPTATRVVRPQEPTLSAQD